MKPATRLSYKGLLIALLLAATVPTCGAQSSLSQGDSSPAILSESENREVTDCINRIAGVSNAARNLRREVPEDSERANAEAHNRLVVQECERKLFRMGEKVIPSLVQAYNRPEREVDAVITKLLGRFGGQSIPALISAFADQELDTSAKIAAAQTLCKIGTASEEPLLKALTGQSEISKIAALQLIAEALPDRGIRRYSLFRGQIISDTEYIVPLSLIPALCATLTSPSDAVRRESAEVLGRIGPRNEQIASALSQGALKDTDAMVRRSCIQSLGSLGNKQSSETAARTAAVLQEALMHDEYEGARLAAAQSLARLDTTAAAIPALTAGLQDPVQAVKIACIQGLAHFGPASASAIAALIQSAKSTDTTEAAESIRALAALGPAAEAAIPALIKLAATRLNDGRFQNSLAETFKSIGPKASPAVPTLIIMLTRAAPYARGPAIDALAAIGPGAAKAVPLLTDIAKNDPSHKQQAERALSSIKGLRSSTL